MKSGTELSQFLRVSLPTLKVLPTTWHTKMGPQRSGGTIAAPAKSI